MGFCIIKSRETDHERLTEWQRLQSAKRKRKTLVVQTNEISTVESARADFTGLELGASSNAMQLVEQLLKADNAVEMLSVLKQVKLPAPSVR